MPDLPGGSSAAPTRYHSMWVTTGVRRSGMTTTSRPFARVNCATAGAARGIARRRRASATQTARISEKRESAWPAQAVLSRPRCLAQTTGQVRREAVNCRCLFDADRAIQNVRDLPAAAFVAAGAIRLVAADGVW